MQTPLICQAISELKALEFLYEDADGDARRRVVEPYAYGRTRRDREALRGYQVGGSSETAVPGWKLFIVERMSGLRMTERSFDGSAPGYAHGDIALSPLYCRVP